MKQPDLISALPDYIDPDLWTDFIQHRKEMKKKLTPTSTRYLLKKLARYHSEGIDVNASIMQALEGTWQGIFPYEKANRAKQNGSGQRETPVQLRERQADEARAEITARYSTA
jgi:hypothetical protein